MKQYIWSLFFLLLACVANAQTGDSLVIHLKNGQKATIALSSIEKITFDSIKSSVSQKNSSTGLNLLPSFPNPSPKAISIPFTIAMGGKVVISIYDNKGVIISILEMHDAQIGRNQIEWDGLDKNGQAVPSGEYFYEVKYKGEVQVKKMVILK